MTNVNDLRQQRQQLNQQMAQGPAANPNLQAQKQAINQQIQAQRGQSQPMQRMPMQGPMQGYGMNQAAQIAGQMYGGGQAWDPQMIPQGTMPAMNKSPQQLGNDMAYAMQQGQPRNPSGMSPLDPNGNMSNAYGSGQGYGPPQNMYGFQNMGAPNAGAMRPSYNAQGPAMSNSPLAPGGGFYNAGGAVRPSVKPQRPQGLMSPPPTLRRV